MPAEIRAARPADVPEIVATTQAAYRGEGGWTTEAHLVRGHRTDATEVRALLTTADVTLLVAVTATQDVVGCCYTARDGDRAELGLFAVDPRAQAGGIGGRLLESQAALLTSAGVRTLMIRVLQARPELHAWYRRHGFVPTGIELPFPADPARLTDPELRMVEMERQLQPL